jgi:mRNA-degrading endonuclease RelE of RelBE toxin-antitoxin system
MKIIFTKNFKKSLLKLEKSIQIRIIEKIDIINKSNDSIYELNLDIKKLQPKEK